MEERQRQALVRLHERIDVDALAAEVVRTLAAEIPGHARLSEELRWQRVYPEVRALIIATSAHTAGGAVKLEGIDLSKPTMAARERAAQGMPLEDVLRTYRIGSRMCWDALKAVAGPDDQEVLMLAAESIMTFTDRATAAVTRAYLEARDTRLSEQERAARHLYQALDGGGVIVGEDAALADRLDLLRPDRFVPFVVRLPGGNALDHAQRAAALREQGTLALSEGDRLVGLHAEDQRPAVVDGEDPALLVAVGPPAPRGAIEATMRQLRAAVEAAARAGVAGAVDVAQFGPEVLVDLVPGVGDALVARVMGPLSEELRETLVTWVRCDFDGPRAARALHLHRNSLPYRLRRVAELTGLRLDAAHDRTTIYLACARMDGGAHVEALAAPEEPALAGR